MLPYQFPKVHNGFDQRYVFLSDMKYGSSKEEEFDDDTVDTECSDETDVDNTSLGCTTDNCCRLYITPISSNKRWILLVWLLFGKVCQLADSRSHVCRNSLIALNGGAMSTEEFIQRGHSHNDYHQEDPLRSALRHGLKSIEVDVFPRKEELLVGHTMFELNVSRTINNMYIQPLLTLIKKSDRATSSYHNRPFPQSRTFQQRQRSNRNVANQQQHLMNRKADALSLLVDFKGDAEKSVMLLREALAPLRPYLSKVDKNGQFQQGKITVLVSGNRPRDESLREQKSGERFLFVDGRAHDLHSNSDPMLVPMISIPWRNLHLARLLGRGEHYMSQLVGRAHAQGKLLRIWGAPNREDLWRLMMRSKVDLLSIDDHGKFAQFASTAAFFR